MIQAQIPRFHGTPRPAPRCQVTDCDLLLWQRATLRRKRSSHFAPNHNRDQLAANRRDFCGPGYALLRQPIQFHVSSYKNQWETLATTNFVASGALAE